MTAFWTKPRNSFAATGFWKPILQLVPDFISGASYSVGRSASTPEYPSGMEPVPPPVVLPPPLVSVATETSGGGRIVVVASAAREREAQADERDGRERGRQPTMIAQVLLLRRTQAGRRRPTARPSRVAVDLTTADRACQRPSVGLSPDCARRRNESRSRSTPAAPSRDGEPGTAAPAGRRPRPRRPPPPRGEASRREAARETPGRRR